MNIKNGTAVLVAILTLGALPTARAGQVGFYVGGSYGQADKDGNKQDFDAFALGIQNSFSFIPTTSSATLDESGPAYGFSAGYRFTPHIAVEGGFMNVGILKYRSRASGLYPGNNVGDLNQNFDSETSGIAVSGLGILPISYRWEVYARLGAMFATNDFRIFLYDDLGNTAQDSFSESSIDMLAGIGTSFTFLEIYDARLEYTRVFDAGDESTGEGDVGMISLGITVGF
jgi:hypothetical protein